METKEKSIAPHSESLDEDFINTLVINKKSTMQNVTEDFFIEAPLAKLKTKSELRPDICNALRNLLSQVEVINYPQTVLFCKRTFGTSVFAARETIDEIASARNINVNKESGVVSLHNYKSFPRMRHQVLSFWTYLDFLPYASDIITVPSPFVHSYFMKDMFVETAVFSYGEETLLMDKIRYQHFPKLTKEECAKRRRIAIIDSDIDYASEIITGCGFTHICHIDITCGKISLIKQRTPEEAWEIQED